MTRYMIHLISSVVLWVRKPWAEERTCK